MHFGKYLKAASLSAMATLGFSVSAFSQPTLYHQEKAAPNMGDMSLLQYYFVDFTTSSANPWYNFPTFPNPRSPSTIVKYANHRITSAVSPGGCYEISTSGASGSDVILSVQNNAGAWTWLADDNKGGGDFIARVYIKPVASYEFRISEFSPGNSNNQVTVHVTKFKLNPGSAINSTSCRVSGQPYWQHDLNGGNPYNPQ